MPIHHVIKTDKAAAPAASYSQGMASESLVFTSGQIGATPDGELAETLEKQVNLAIDNLEEVLRAGGTSLDKVLKTTCFLAKAEDFPEFDKLYRARFKEPFPPRSTVAVEFGGPGILVEIEAIAAK